MKNTAIFLATACFLFQGEALAQETESQANANGLAQAVIISEAPGEVLYNTPNVIPPALTAGLNQCAQSTSAGLSFAGFSISFGRSRKDNMCETINAASFFFNSGMPETGKEILCSNDKIRRAFIRSNDLCLVDRENIPVRIDTGEPLDLYGRVKIAEVPDRR